MERFVLVVAAVMAAAVVLGSFAARRRRRRAAVPLDEVLRSAPGGDLDLSGVVAGRVSTPPVGGVGVWTALGRRTDLSLFRPRLAPNVEIKIFHLRWGNDHAIAFDPRTFKHYGLEVWEAELLPLMDGTRTVSDLVVDRLDASGSIDADGIAELVLSLREHGYFDPPSPNVHVAVEQHLRTAGGRVDAMRQALRTLKIEWEGADRFVKVLYRAGFRWLFTRPSALISAVIAVAGLAAFFRVTSWGRFSIDAAAAPAEAAVLIVLGGVLTFAHELGHALVITHHRRRIGSAGFMLYFGSPAFFVDASDSLMLDRRSRMLQSGMGPFFELVLAGFASLVLFALPELPAASLLYRFALINYFVILLNLVPLLELDGYWLLSDAIQVPDLRPRSLQFTRHDLWHKLWKRERFSLQEMGLAAYGIIGVLFTVLSLASAAFFWQITFGGVVEELWAQGLATRVLLLAFVLLFAGPAIRGAIILVRAIARRGGALVRKVRFRVETSWRIEAAQLIDALPGFDDLPVDTLNDLAGRVLLREVASGEPIFRQGDRADAFYVVRSGLVHIEQEHPATGDVHVLATLGRGESFGELGLLHAAPRAATARAVEPSRLFVVPKSAFDHLLASEIDAPSFGPTLQSLADLRALAPFTHLGTEPLAELLEHGEWVSAAPGDELVRMGEPGDAFYVIERGQADVVQGGERIGHLGAGSYFGELALIGDAPRSASVIATTPMRLFRLDREGFERVVLEAFDRGVLRPQIERTWEH